jgi:RimJ/RimL family protein N-acetyltransferase
VDTNMKPKRGHHRFGQAAFRPGTLTTDLLTAAGSAVNGETEIGSTLAPTHQGKGYATEAIRALLDQAFTTMALHRVVAMTDARNNAAAALLSWVGMRSEAHLHDNVSFKGEWGSERLFAKLAREHEPFGRGVGRAGLEAQWMKGPGRG